MLLPLLPSELPSQGSTSQNTRTFCYKGFEMFFGRGKGGQGLGMWDWGPDRKMSLHFPWGFGHCPSDLSLKEQNVVTKPQNKSAD